MFEKQVAELRVLANVADAQRLDRARDLIREAASIFEQRGKELDDEYGRVLRKAAGISEK